MGWLHRVGVCWQQSPPVLPLTPLPLHLWGTPACSRLPSAGMAASVAVEMVAAATSDYLRWCVQRARDGATIDARNHCCRFLACVRPQVEVPASPVVATAPVTCRRPAPPRPAPRPRPRPRCLHRRPCGMEGSSVPADLSSPSSRCLVRMLKRRSCLASAPPAPACLTLRTL
jgi:hypothetical protein